MPVATRGVDTISRVFVDQMGLTMAQATALLGAHTLGGMSPANSGFGIATGFGQDVQTPWVEDNTELNNDYFDEMIERRWDPHRSPGDAFTFPAFAPPVVPQQWHDETHPTPPSKPGPIPSSSCMSTGVPHGSGGSVYYY